MNVSTIGIELRTSSGPGVLHELTGVIARHQANILSVDFHEDKTTHTNYYFEIEAPGDPSVLVASLRELPVVSHAAQVETLLQIYGKRIIIMGGGAQVGHHDRQGGGQNPTSWNSAHTTPGCGIEQLRRVGGEGFFYCFASR